MRRFLSILLLLSSIVLLDALAWACETLEEFLLPAFKPDSYQETKVRVDASEIISKFIESHPGEPIPQSTEIIVYDERSPTFVPHKSKDGLYEFIQPGVESKSEKIRQCEEFDNGRMDEVKDIQKPPYRFLGNLLIIFPHSEESKDYPGRCIGSGVLIGPNHVLTARHNLWDPKRGGWAQEIIFTPTQQRASKPFGEARAIVLNAFKGGIQEEDETYDYDMGMIVLDRPIGYRVGWAGLAIIKDKYYQDKNPQIKIAGYPFGDVELLTQGGTVKISTALMREHSGVIQTSKDRRLYYKINTRGGQSGSPIVAYLKELDGYFVLGIHTHGGNEANEGTRLTANKFWRIRDCREKFNLPPSEAISGEVAEKKKILSTPPQSASEVKYEILLNTPQEAPLKSDQGKERNSGEEEANKETIKQDVEADWNTREQILSTVRGKSEESPNARLWESVTENVMGGESLPDRPKEFIESAPEGSTKSYLTGLWEKLYHSGVATLATSPHLAEVAGMGGLGKTYLALKYAYEALDNKAYHLIYWFKSETDLSLIEGYTNLLETLGVALTGEENPNKIITLIKRKIPPLKGKCLLIYDNVPFAAFLDNKTPQKRDVDILITSRCIGGWKEKPIGLEVFRPQDSIDYLFKVINEDPPEIECTPETMEEALKVAIELGHLPLALSYAAAYINYKQKSNKKYDFGYYYKDFKQTQTDILKTNSRYSQGKTSINNEYLVSTTLEMAKSIISDPAKQLLNYFAYLDSDSFLKEPLELLIKNKEELEDSFADLVSFSLIKNNGLSFSIHRLVQLVLRTEQEKEENLLRLPSTIDSILSGFYKYWQQIDGGPDAGKALDLLKATYQSASILRPNLEHLYKHFQRLGQDEKIEENQLFNFKIATLCLAELLKYSLADLRERTFQQYLGNDAQERVFQESLLKDEFYEYGLELNKDNLKEILNLIPFNLKRQQRVEILEALQNITSSQRQNIIKDVQDFLTPEMESGERAQVLRVLSSIECFQRPDIIQRTRDLLGDEMKGKNGALVIQALGSINCLERENFVQKVKQVFSAVQGDERALFIRILSGMKPSLSLEMKNKYWDSFLESLNKLTPCSRAAFVQSAHALLSSKMTVPARAQAIEALSKINFLQFKTFIDIAYNLLNPEIIGEDWAFVFGALKDMDASSLQEFMNGKNYLLQPQRSIPQEISHFKGSQIDAIFHDLLTPEMKGEDQASIMTDLLQFDDLQYNAFLKSVFPLLAPEISPESRVSIIKTLILLEPYHRDMVVQCTGSLLSGPTQANIILILAKMTLEEMNMVCTKVHYLLKLSQKESQSFQSSEIDIGHITRTIIHFKGLECLIKIVYTSLLLPEKENKIVGFRF